MAEIQSESTYYLPVGYDDNKIILLARDPHWLYAYWEISNEKRNRFYEELGQGLWEKSVPVLKVTNVSINSSFFVRINDFSSSWYINVADADCLYMAEIGRKLDQFYINLASSNYISTPTDSVSHNTSARFIDYKELRKSSLDIETGKVYESLVQKSASQMVFGISSPELFGKGLQETLFGISSAQFLGAGLQEVFGISSGGFQWGISSDSIIK